MVDGGASALGDGVGLTGLVGAEVGFGVAVGLLGSGENVIYGVMHCICLVYG